jgi:GPH family glycoside/pentoside/hexuronide:cation symporter
MPMSMLALVSNVLLMRFMTDSLGIAAALAATLFSLAKLWDAIADPIIGTLSDRIRTPWGRRLPWLLAGAVLTPLAAVLLYAVPAMSPTATAIYMGTTMVLFATVYTVFMIPYMAMPAEITSSYHGRTQLMSARVVFSSGGSIIGLGIAPWLLATWGATRDGHLKMASALALVGLVLGLLCVWSVRKAPRVEPTASGPHLPTLHQFRSALENRPFAWLMFAKCSYFVALAFILTTMPYFSKHVLGASDKWLSAVLTIQTLTVIASQVLWLKLARVLGKRHAFLIAAVFYCGAIVSWWLAAPGEPFWLTALRVVVLGTGAGGVFLTTQAMLPDAIEADAHRTGHQRAGLFTGVYVFVEQVAAAVGVAAIGWFLGAMGYVQAVDGQRVAQPESAVLAIYLCVSFIPAAFVVIAMLAIRQYDIDAAALERLRRESVRNSALQ